MKFTLLICLFALLGISCGKQAPPDINENSSGNPATAPVDYLGAVNKGRKKAITDSALMQVNGALNQFKASNSRSPAFLNELITEGLLRELPELPAGTKWTYDPKTGVASVIPAQ
tara:strand:+ start:759 stop:1103 length:345 start_codon:yes stop_codon:yes gene_type:complete